ncbi:MAG TPA: putative Fe-S cluster assembly protein SufT [Wenzhouxiangella sp.]
MLSNSYAPVRFDRDCEVIMVPEGETVELPAGTSGYLTQSLGGSFTIFVEGRLFRLNGDDADAIGKQPPPRPQVPEGASDEDYEDLVHHQLTTIYDPEIPINIVDLGLIYDCQVHHNDPENRVVDVAMTLTAPGCGMGEILVEDVRDRLKLIPTVTEVNVALTFDPPWNQSMMSEAARLETGMF